jgi:preprotein translocase subunit SecG
MESFAHALPWIQGTVAVILILAILLQRSGSGLGGAFGGGDGVIYHTKRGFEKFLFQLTIVLAVLFAALSLAHFFV